MHGRCLRTEVLSAISAGVGLLAVCLLIAGLGTARGSDDEVGPPPPEVSPSCEHVRASDYEVLFDVTSQSRPGWDVVADGYTFSSGSRVTVLTSLDEWSQVAAPEGISSSGPLWLPADALVPAWSACGQGWWRSTTAGHAGGW